jgi:hypothetical protein
LKVHDGPGAGEGGGVGVDGEAGGADVGGGPVSGAGAVCGDELDGTGAGAGGAPCVTVSRTPLMRMAPMRTSLDAFALATMTSVPSPWPFAGDTCSHED